MPNFHDGVWFVDLAAVTDPYLVAVAVAEVLGVRPEPGRPILETLAEYVGSRNLLLFLDTCDAHLQRGDAVRRPACWPPGPGVRVLATSREPIGAPGELVWRIPPMAVDRTATAPARRTRWRCCVDRAEAARGGRAAGPEEMPHLLRVAQRLDGLPLALELAAARLRLFSAAQLADRLDDLLGTLDAGERPDRRVQHRDRRPAPAQHAPGHRRLVLPDAAARARPPCCASSRSSPARSTWPRWSGSPAPSSIDRWPSWSTSRWWSSSPGPTKAD